MRFLRTVVGTLIGVMAVGATFTGMAAAVHWAPKPIASAAFESHAAFDPKTGDLWFVRSTPAFEGWRLWVSRCTNSGWSTPTEPPFAGDGVEADPYFTPDGRSLYFISTRTTDGVKKKDLDLWRVDRGLDGTWGTPERLPAPLNSPAQEWFPRPAVDGWLYFGSGRKGGLGRTDIWRARREGARGWSVENAGPTINTAADEYEPLPSPDGSIMIFMAGDGLYRSKRVGDGWAARERLGPNVNVDDSAIGPLFSPSGRSLLFSRDIHAAASGEFFVAHLEGQAEVWPPTCPRSVSSPHAAPVAASELWTSTQALLDAVARGDVKVWSDLLDERAIMVDENDEVRTKAQVLAELKPLPKGLVGSLRVETFRAEVHDDVVVVTHEDEERLDYHGQFLSTRFRMLDTWKRNAGRFRLLGSQVLAVLEDPPVAALPLEADCPYAGSYRLDGNAPEVVARLRCEGDALVATRENRPAASYKREIGDVFFLPGQPRSRRLFERDAAAKVTGFRDRREGRDLVWRRIEPQF